MSYYDCRIEDRVDWGKFPIPSQEPRFERLREERVADLIINYLPDPTLFDQQNEEKLGRPRGILIPPNGTAV